mgnify:CR=1 FL=1
MIYPCRHSQAHLAVNARHPAQRGLRRPARHKRTQAHPPGNVPSRYRVVPRSPSLRHYRSPAPECTRRPEASRAQGTPYPQRGATSCRPLSQAALGMQDRSTAIIPGNVPGDVGRQTRAGDHDALLPTSRSGLAGSGTFPGPLCCQTYSGKHQGQRRAGIHALPGLHCRRSDECLPRHSSAEERHTRIPRIPHPGTGPVCSLSAHNTEWAIRPDERGAQIHATTKPWERSEKAVPLCQQQRTPTTSPSVNEPASCTTLTALWRPFTTASARRYPCRPQSRYQTSPSVERPPVNPLRSCSARRPPVIMNAKQ